MQNAGSRLTENMLTSIELLSTVGIPIGLLLIIPHTDCGGLFHGDDGVRKVLSERSPDHVKDIEHKTWHAFHDIGIEQSINDDVAAMKKWLNDFEFLPKDTPMGGYIFDIKTGLLKELVAPEFK